jgi:hypothetical protein
VGACVCPPPNRIVQVYPAMGSPLPSSIDHPQSSILIHDQCLPSSYSVLAGDIYPPPFQLLVGERSCRPSPNHHSFSSALLPTYTVEGIASLTATCPTHYKWHFGYYGGSVTIQAGYLSMPAPGDPAFPIHQRSSVIRCPVGSISPFIKSTSGRLGMRGAAIVLTYFLR